jgi:hypothetical protein
VKRSDPNRIAVMDVTLRDGEQTPDVAYTAAEKLQLARLLLEDVGVDRIEIASSRVSEGEREAARLIAEWARKQRLSSRVEILGYSDGTTSVDWIVQTGGRVLNLLLKGSERHCRGQLNMTPERHRGWVGETVRYARRKRLTVNVYLEDWSNGVRDSFDYVFAMVQLLRELNVDRIYLPDTLGVFAPDDVERYVGLMSATWPDVVSCARARAACTRASTEWASGRGTRASPRSSPPSTTTRRCEPGSTSLASPPYRGWWRPSAARTSPPTRRSWDATPSPRPPASTPTAT